LSDPEGDTGISVVFFLDTPAKATEIARALSAENISAAHLYDPDRVDYHIYAHWQPIIEKRTWTERGGPWRWGRREVEYPLDACPRTLDLLGRAVHLDVSPLLTNQDVEEVVEGVDRVLTRLA
jgi:hypothetical protein